jgi:hypothetical protein
MAKAQKEVTTVENNYEFDSEKKGSWRYNCTDKVAHVSGSVYLSKETFKVKPGDKLVLSINIREQ